MSLLSSLLGQQQREFQQTEKKKAILLEDPKKLDDYVGKIFQGVSPSKKVADTKKAAFLTDRVNAKIPDDHPMKNFGQELKENLATELASPKNAGYSSKDITTGIVKYMLEEQDPETKMTRLEKAYQSQRMNQTSRGIIPLFSGENKSLKAPSALPGMQTYDEWRQERFAKEKAVTGEEYNLENYPTAIANAARNVGVISGTAALIGSLIAGPAAPVAAGVSAPLATAIGAIAGAAGEAVAYPIRAALRNTEWGSAREYSGKLKDAITLGAIDIGIDAATFGPVEMKFLKSVKTATDLKSLAVAKPSAANVVKADAADKLVAEEGKKVAKAAVKGKRVKVQKAGEEATVSAEKELAGLSEEGQIKAATHPEGVEKGIAVVAEEEDSLKWFSGEKTADKEVGRVKAEKRGKRKGKKKVTGTEGLEEASKAMGEEWSGRAVPRRAGGGDEGLAQGMREAGTEVTEEGFTATGPVRTGGGDDVLAAGMKEAERTTALPAKEVVAEKSKEILSSPTAGKAFANLEHESQTEVLTRAQDRKAIDEVVDFFGEGKVEIAGKETAITKADPVVSKLYKDMEVYQDSLLKKYYPELKLDSKEDLPKIMDAVTSLGKRVPKEEVKVLDDMVAEYEKLTEPGALQVTKAAKVLEKEMPSLTLGDALKEGQGILARKSKENLTPVDELPLWEDLSMRIQGSAKILPTDKREHLRAVENIITTLKKKSSLLTAFAAFGVGSEVFDWFAPAEAEAGMLSSVGKLVGKVTGTAGLETAQTKLMAELYAKQHIVDKIADPNVFHVAGNMWQKGLGDSAAGGPSMVLRNISEFMQTHSAHGLQRILSPDQVFNLILKTKEKIMNNPAVVKASYMMAEIMNTTNGMTVMGNILRAAGIKPAVKETAKAFEHLTPMMKEQVGFDYYTERVGDLTDQLRKLYGKKNRTKAVEEGIQSTKQQLAIARKNIAKYKPGMELFHQEYDKAAYGLALRSPAARVFYAANDDVGKWTKHSFMKDIQLSKAEQVAVGRIKRQMGTYKQRLEDEGIATKSGPYMHYTLHPKVNAAMMEDITGDIASAPYLKNYSRSLNSRPLMPDVFASMGHYIPDVERRLQTQGFWNSGWKRVANKTKFIEPLRAAFEALENGTKPFENSWGNTAARWYTTFEVFKRLFGLPSAAIKHAAKISGDMATLGVGPTVGALPDAAKGVTWRIIENTPFMKNIAKKHFANASSFDKFKKSLFDSVVPAQNLHWRMSQMGFGNYDSYFTKLEKIANQTAHVGTAFINFTELGDRGVSVTAGLMMAAKKGMTAEQALYGIYDTILKNNFLGREFTPRWLQNPKVGALLLFAKTPYKILQRRLVIGMKAGRSVDNMGKEIRKATRTPEGRQRIMSDLQSLIKDMRATEMEMKSNIFLDSIRSEQDFYGNSAVKQFTRDILITGAATITGASVGANLWHHFFHIPFVKSNNTRNTDVALSISPAAQAALESWDHWQNRDEGDDELLVTKLFNRWLGASGPFPDIVNKLNRINQDDIPEIYGDSKLMYLLSIPKTKED